MTDVNAETLDYTVQEIGGCAQKLIGKIQSLFANS